MPKSKHKSTVTTSGHQTATTHVPTCPDQLLFKAAVHYLGRKAPTPSIDGMESIQKPLREIYTACPCAHTLKRDTPGDAYLVILTSGVYILPVNPLDQKIWIRMQDFRGCGVVKGVGSDYTPAGACSLTFMAIDSPEAKRSPLPVIFTILAARGPCLPLVDCYAFSCPNEQVAISLASSTKSAFANRSGWSTSNKPPCINILDLDENTCFDKCAKQETEYCDDFVNPELYQKPPLNGYFYASNPGMIRSYDLGVEAEAVPLPPPEIPPEPAPVTHPPHHQCLIVSQDLPPPQTYFYPPPEQKVAQPPPPPNIYISVNQSEGQIAIPDEQDVQISYDRFICRQNETQPMINAAAPNLVDVHQWINGQEFIPQEFRPQTVIPPSTTIFQRPQTTPPLPISTMAPSVNAIAQPDMYPYPVEGFYPVFLGPYPPSGIFPDPMAATATK